MEFTETGWRLLGYAIVAGGTMWGVLWSFAKWAMPAKVEQMVNSVVAPRLDRMESMLSSKADTSDLIAMEIRFEKRMEPYLEAIKQNTASSATSLEGVNRKLGDLSERVSYIEGTWDGTTERRQHGRRATD